MHASSTSRRLRSPGNCRIAMALSLMTGLVTPIASAQRIAPLAVTPVRIAAPDTLHSVVASSDSSVSPGWHFAARAGLGVVGALAGGVVGGLVGADAASGCHGEFCNLGDAAIGAAVGSVAAAAVMSAFPTFGSSCSTESRVGRAILGAVAGGVVGALPGAVIGGVAVATFLVGEGAGAALSAASC
jgi:hypothetical protein